MLTPLLFLNKDGIGNVSRASISQWETGSTKGLKPENLLNAAKCLGESIEWLVIGENTTDKIKIESNSLSQKSKNNYLTIFINGIYNITDDFGQPSFTVGS